MARVLLQFKKVRAWASLLFALLLLATVSGSNAMAAPGDSTVRLGWSASPNATALKPLNKATVKGKIYVGLVSSAITKVDFYLNDPTATRQPIASDTSSPFMVGTNGVDTTKLKTGTHSILAVVTTAGGTQKIIARFAVKNAKAAAGGSSSATRAPAKVPVGKKVVFRGDFETGDTTQWENCQAGKDSGDCSEESTTNIKLLKGNNVRQGKTAVAFIVNEGDFVAEGERSEVASHGAAAAKEGDERWYQFSFRFPPNFKNPSGGWYIPMQWHDSAGSPPLALNVSNDGLLQIGGDGVDHEKKTLGPVRKGVWVDYVLHVMFSSSESKGFVEGWENGKKTVPKYNRATMDDSSPHYLKMGLYRDKDMSGTSEIWQDGLIITAP